MGETIERKLKDYKGFCIFKVTDNKGLRTEETTYLAYTEDNDLLDGAQTLSDLKKKIDIYVGKTKTKKDGETAGMSQKEFEDYLNDINSRVLKWKSETPKLTNDDVRCRMMGWLGAEKKYTFTGKQLKQIFELCF